MLLPTPVMLEAGKSYRITQTCSENMPDLWPDTAANAPHALTAAATLGPGVFTRGAPGTFPTSVQTVGRWAGIATFKVQTPARPASASPPVCVCDLPAAPFGQGQGTIKYLPSGESIGFPPRCEPFPRETILENHNPTCDIRTYAGGLSTCHHGWHLVRNSYICSTEARNF